MSLSRSVLSNSTVQPSSFGHNEVKILIAVLATTGWKSTCDTVPYFGLNRLSMILCLWYPLHPLSKLLAIPDHAQNLEEQLWMGGRSRERSVLYLTDLWLAVIWSKKDRFFVSVSTFLQLVFSYNWWLKNIYFALHNILSKGRFYRNFNVCDQQQLLKISWMSAKSNKWCFAKTLDRVIWLRSMGQIISLNHLLYLVLNDLDEHVILLN